MLIVAATAAVVLATRLPAQGQYLFSWDSVNFALGMERIDIGQHQPHPPGYVGYVAAARVLRFGASENTALLRVNIVAAVSSALLLWYLVLRITRSWRSAAVGWTILLTSPLHWFYSDVGEIYAAELLVTLAIAAAAYGSIQAPHSRTWPWLLGGAVAVAALCKVSAALLLSPVVAYAAIRMGPSARRAMILVLLIGASAALLVVASVSGLDKVWELSVSQFGAVSATAALGGFNPRALNQSARDFLYAGIAAVGVGGLAAVFLRRRVGPELPLLFVTIWVLPYVAVCLLVHFPKPGYALPLLAPLALWLAAGFAWVSWSRTALAIMVITSLNIAQFAAAQPWSAEQTGGQLRYADKSRVQRLRTELNSVMRPSLHTIREHDKVVRWFLGASSSTCAGVDSALLISAGAPVTWRHAMFYMPEATVLQLPSARDGLLIGNARHVLKAAEGDIVLHARCTILIGDQFEGLELSLDRRMAGKVVMGHERFLWTREPLTMGLAPDGRVLRIRP